MKTVYTVSCDCGVTADFRYYHLALHALERHSEKHAFHGEPEQGFSFCRYVIEDDEMFEVQK